VDGCIDVLNRFVAMAMERTLGMSHVVASTTQRLERMFDTRMVEVRELRPPGSPGPAQLQLRLPPGQRDQPPPPGRRVLTAELRLSTESRTQFSSYHSPRLNSGAHASGKSSFRPV
jgi:hypothetical protein